MRETKEELQDKYFIPEKSLINLDSPHTSGNLGFGGYAAYCPYADFVLVEFIDMNDGQIEDDDGLVRIESTKQAWRKGIVRMIGPVVERRGVTKVGDIIAFPSDHGLKTGNITYTDASGELHSGKDCIFLNEERIFTKLLKITSC